MLLTVEEFGEIAHEIAMAESGITGLDFETTGLSPYKGARAFILGFTFECEKFSVFLDDPDTASHLSTYCSNPRLYYAAHNAKFEMAFLKAQFGCEIRGRVWDTEALARLEFNNHRRYSLEFCAEREGLSKYKPAMEWGKKEGKLHHEWPLELVVPYVEHDAWLSDYLCRKQRATFVEWQTNSPTPIQEALKLEIKTTKNLFEMESAGIPVNVPLCREAFEYETGRANVAATEFTKLTGVEFIDHANTYKPLFIAMGIEIQLKMRKNKKNGTEKETPTYEYDALIKHQGNPVIDQILAYREANKRANTYWKNFIELEAGGVIYPNINQGGAGTGRFSAREPNVQNWPDDGDETKYPVRRGFTARPGSKIVSIDYAQMEYRFVADEAGDMEVIKAIQAGMDVHQKYADKLGLPRKRVKNAVFAKLYGAGVKRIAFMLNISFPKARELCEAIDEAAPRITEYCNGLTAYAKYAPYGFNYLGRRYYFDKGYAYKYPDYRVQGGCAEILRKDLDDIIPFLKKYASPVTQLLIPIHDELVFNFHEKDLHLIPEIERIMIAAHTSKRFLDMSCSITLGENFHDLENYQRN